MSHRRSFFPACECRKLRSPAAGSVRALYVGLVSVGSAAVAGRSRGVVLSFAYWPLRRLLELLVLWRRPEREKEIEILLLRHQLQLLERQVGAFTPSAC
jgi:hypothetical protein